MESFFVKGTSYHMFGCEFCEYFQNHLSAEDLRAISSCSNLGWVGNTQLKIFLKENYHVTIHIICKEV